MEDDDDDDDDEEEHETGERDLQSAASHDSTARMLDARIQSTWLTAHVWGINSTSIFKASGSENAPELGRRVKRLRHKILYMLKRK